MNSEDSREQQDDCPHCGRSRAAHNYPEDAPETGPDRIRRAIAIDRGGEAPREPFVVCDHREGNHEQ